MAASNSIDHKACVAEIIATFALCFIGGGAICINAILGDHGPGLLGIALAHGIILSVAVTATMNVSGAHVNPAVTIAMLLTGRIGAARAISYIVSQCAGGIAAGGLLSMIFAGMKTPGGQFVIPACALGTPNFDPTQLTSGMAILIEVLLTFLLMFAIFGTAVDPRHPNVGGFGIGLTVTADILLGGPLTGAAMNPARVLGTGLFSQSNLFATQHWIYWVGPCVGAIAGALIYDMFVMEKKRA